MEQVRANLRKRYITIIQSVVRRFVYRRRFLRLQRTALGIQRYARGLMSRQKAQQLRERRAAMIISKYAKGWLCRRRYVRLRHSICGIQQYARGMLARRKFRDALDHYRATQIQRFMRGYLARREYHKRRRQIIICQSAVRRFLARKQFKRMKAEAKTVSHIQKKYHGLENKIITMQQRIDELNKENSNFKHKMSEISVLKMKLEIKKALENEVKNLKNQIQEKDEKIQTLTNKLEVERDEKMQLLQESAQAQEEWAKHKTMWCAQNTELRQQLDEMIENAKRTAANTSERTELLISEVDNNEIHEAYQKALKDKEIIENENYHLKEELHRLSRKYGGEFSSLLSQHRRSFSNASSHEEDIGYSSAKNTLEHKSLTNMENNQISPEAFRNVDMTSTPKNDNTTVMLKLKHLFDVEKKRNKTLQEHLEKAISRHRPTEDSLRVSELEVENEKLRHDYELLRHSIRNGAEMQELEAQYNALQEELRRRRDECIQLKAVLQQQTQSLKSFGPESLQLRSMDSQPHDSELMEAFQAQKLVNRQLESELSALTEENNANFDELTRQLDDLRQENAQLQELLHSGLDEATESNESQSLQQNIRYLKHELKKTMMQYSQVQEELNAFVNKYNATKHRSERLSLKLEEHGISDHQTQSKGVKLQTSKVEVAKQQVKPNSYQGITYF